LSELGRTAPCWTPGGQLQTLVPTIVGRYLQPLPVHWTRERLFTPDHDFIDVDWSGRSEHPGAPRLILFHGLEGSSSSHYVRAFATVAAALGWSFAIPHFRGCSGALNLAPRAYHAGDYQEVAWMLEQLTRDHAGPVYAVGVSLGGNALLQWAAHRSRGDVAGPGVRALCALSAPLDLAACGDAIDHGLNQRIYGRYFLKTMKEKARLKAAQYRGLFNLEAIEQASTLRTFDHFFTAPLHGFSGVDDYWSRASSGSQLRHIGLPSLVVNALNDPLVPAQSLTPPADCSSAVTVWRPRDGGHVGFGAGGQCAFASRVLAWLARAGG
jgi:predicted alpha/beta-fold hydrolase